MAQKITKQDIENVLKHYSIVGGIARFARDIMIKRLTYAIPEFHKTIYEALRKNNRLAIAAPRSFAKTTVTDVIYPSYLALMNIPNRNNIAIFSASQGLAIEQLKKIKYEYDNNQLLIGLYMLIHGKAPHSDKDTWRDDEIQFSNGVVIQARGAGGQTRGKRPNVVICDDLETTESVRSSDQRKYLDEWFRKDILGLLEHDGQLIIIGTILHFASLLKTLISEMKQLGWKTRIYQAYKDGIQQPGYELWPEKWPHEALQQRKAEQGTAYFSSEYMNDPVNIEDAVFKTSYIRRYSKLPDKYSSVMVIDPAYSEKSSSDYKACVVIATDPQNNRYTVDKIRTKKPEADYITACINMYLANRDTIMYVGIPGGREIDFQKKVLELASQRGVYLPYREIKNSAKSTTGVTERNKKARITMTLQALFQSGKYYVHDTHDDIVDELLSHPSGRYDDLIDCMASAEQLITPVYFDVPNVNEQYNEEPIKIYRGDSGYGI